MTDLYAMLGVAPGASEDEIRSAYHRRLRFDAVETPEGNQRMRELREAYEVLSDPERRAQLRRRPRRLGAGVRASR